MDEFSLIERYFASISNPRQDVIFGIGDDAACLRVPADMDLLVSTDTLVEGVHFLAEWDPYDIASRAIKVNISDMAAMAATPCWVTLALTLPSIDERWLQRFSAGMADSLNEAQITLVGGDTTRGPLTITVTIHGLVPSGHAVRRSGATVGDCIIVTGPLGAAALAVHCLRDESLDDVTRATLMKKLLHPQPRLDFKQYLRDHASAAIDISDGLSADLNHILKASQVGACLFLESIPVHPFVQAYMGEQSLDFAMSKGDDYELCFTAPAASLSVLDGEGLAYYQVGVIEAELGLRAKTQNGDIVPMQPKGYAHF
jgi:thiamine-monophosphate kinase